MKTIIENTVDVTKPGEHRYDVPVAWEGGKNGDGSCTIPVIVYNHGDGPSVLLSGGIHGDEYEGPSCLWDCLNNNKFSDVVGRLIVIPVVNPPALKANKRCSPTDKQDMNRSFPGRPTGTTTDVIAHFISTEIIPHVDYVFDLHAGGKIDTIAPSIMTLATENKELSSRSVEAIDASGLPVILLIDELSQKGMIDAEAMRQGKVFGCAELGGSGDLTPDSFALTQAAVRNLLRYTGSLSGEREPITWLGETHQRYTRVDEQELYVVNSLEGLFIPEKKVGDTIVKGERIGQIVSTDTSNSRVEIITAPEDGFVYILCAGGYVEKDRDLLTIAKSVSREELLS